ncbi:hypothetical protein [Streptomyces sp. TS71-3]|uniref:hypothetical protein n=1 Tax=Streptomyces sp. TS71-3 TaxID=2733862 RepID=UPI001AFEE0A0|nr:hypothetical protein [Streptomyces sp. TS71-3]GHJ38603.1 hypothetical protein Sm713_42120 [Streptomyces sp. TS71-3]
MQTYDPARRPPYPNPIPAMRLAPERSGGRSATPIYDRLYAEYRMAFRTLPGDRSGEEDLGFKGFAALPGPGTELSGPGHGHPEAPGGAPSPGTYPLDRGGLYQTGIWRPVGRSHGPEELLPAVLPTRHRRTEH